MNISKLKTLIWVLISALWIGCIVSGTTGHFVVGMVLGTLLSALHMVLGVAKKDVVSKKFLIYPIGVWTVLFSVAFILCGYYADLFAGTMPDFLVLGLHPSFAPVIFLYWIGGLLSLSLGYYLFQDEWLSQKDWDDFCNKAKQIKSAGQEEEVK